MIMALVCLLAASCASKKNIHYMVDIDQVPQEVLNQATRATDLVVVPGDVLDILVTGSNMEAVKPFNRSSYLQDVSTTTMNNNSNNANSMLYYLVDNNGDIMFPVIGKMHVGGMTKTQVQDYICSQLSPTYLAAPPVVEMRFRNFKVVVLGEVSSPSVITSDTETLTILEALAKVGDLQLMGERNTVMLVRTDIKGNREVHRINLNDKNLMLSPYFYLQQNDVLYVQPNGSRARSAWSMPPAWGVATSILSVAISIATLVITLTKIK